MASFIMALTINPSAKKEHDNLSHQVNQSLDLFAEYELHVTSLFATLGRYDYLAHFEADDQADAFKVATAINRRGILETETWPVISMDDFTALLK